MSAGAGVWKAATGLLKGSIKAASASLSNITGGTNDLSPGHIVSVGGLRVEILRKLAEGGFAFVYLVKDLQSGQPLALKRLLVNDPDDLSKVKEEISFLVSPSSSTSLPPHGRVTEIHPLAQEHCQLPVCGDWRQGWRRTGSFDHDGVLSWYGASPSVQEVLTK
jgi:hypothetical protein